MIFALLLKKDYGHFHYSFGEIHKGQGNQGALPGKGIRAWLLPALAGVGFGGDGFHIWVMYYLRGLYWLIIELLPAEKKLAPSSGLEDCPVTV